MPLSPVQKQMTSVKSFLSVPSRLLALWIALPALRSLPLPVSPLDTPRSLL